MFLHILHMPSFKKLALIATEIKGKTSAETAETADTATEPKTIPPAIFKNGWEVKKMSLLIVGLLDHVLKINLVVCA